MRVRTWLYDGLIAASLIGIAYCGYQIWQLSAPGQEHPIALGTAADWFAAVCTALAAAAALYIATKDRRERNQERKEADEALAELVVVTVTVERSQYLAVNVANYGTRAVLDLSFLTATFDTVPQSTAVLGHAPQSIPVLDCDRQAHVFWIDFHVDNASVLPGEFDVREHRWSPAPNRPDVSAVMAKVAFRDAEGTRWVRSNRGRAARLSRVE